MQNTPFLDHFANFWIKQDFPQNSVSTTFFLFLLSIIASNFLKKTKKNKNKKKKQKKTKQKRQQQNYKQQQQQQKVRSDST